MESSKGGGNDSLTPSDFSGLSVNDERRREPRYLAGKTISIMPCDRDWNMRFHRVEMVDCSLHGIGIISPLQLQAGERFLAKLRVSKRLVLSVYTSRHCTPEGKAYKIGAEFSGFISGVKDDPDQILKALVTGSESI
jgi:PilZ domain